MAMITGTGVVYQIVNILDGKRYVGSTFNKKRRITEHVTDLGRGVHVCVHLQNAYNKHGRQSFTIFEIIEEFDLPEIEDTKFNKRTIWRQIILEREQVYLDLLNDDDYNDCRIAGSRLGSEQPEEFKQRASIWAKAHMSRPEIAEKYRQLRLGKTWETLFGVEQSTRMKQGITDKRVGKRLGISPPNKGVPMSEEQNIILQAARAAYVAEHGVWNAGLTWGEVFGPEVAAERKAEYARLADKWFSVDENRARHRDAIIKGTQERVEREGRHWKEGSSPTVETRRATVVTKGAPLYTFQGEQRTVTEIARMAGLERATVRDRLARGETIEEATRAELSKGGAKLGHVISDETAAKISAAQKGKPREWQKGKSSKPSKSGQYGIKWRGDRHQWQVQIEGKPYGNFKEDDLEGAIKRRDEVVAMLANQKEKANG